ncbi:hypothetical protein [Bacillus andreraoultii]|uniref:hypothetical protein n=1 Tax=Bacillus andreraoultii TaxID=1499685 RepID=UPI00053A8C29|nr:hypothetical protein [Bacillus andreraoultii]
MIPVLPIYSYNQYVERVASDRDKQRTVISVNKTNKIQHVLTEPYLYNEKHSFTNDKEKGRFIDLIG